MIQWHYSYTHTHSHKFISLSIYCEEEKKDSRHHKRNQLTNQKNRFKWKQKNIIKFFQCWFHSPHIKPWRERSINKQANKKKSELKKKRNANFMTEITLVDSLYIWRWSHKTHATTKRIRKKKKFLIHSSHFLFCFVLFSLHSFWHTHSLFFLMCFGFQCDRKVSMEFPFIVMHFSGNIKMKIKQ